MTTRFNKMQIVLKLVNLRLKTDGSDELMSDLVVNSIVAAVDTCSTDLLTFSFDESLCKSMDGPLKVLSKNPNTYTTLF